LDKEMMTPQSATLTAPLSGEPKNAEIAQVVRDLLTPIMETIGQLLRDNTEAMQQIAAAQQLASARISDLEKRMRLQTPMSKTQEKYVQDAIRRRAKEILEAKCTPDKKAVTKLSGAIRKSILTRHGVATLRECPAYDYETTLAQVSKWNDFPVVREIAREAREREEAFVAERDPAAGDHGQAAGERRGDQPADETETGGGAV